MPFKRGYGEREIHDGRGGGEGSEKDSVGTKENRCGLFDLENTVT